MSREKTGCRLNSTGRMFSFSNVKLYPKGSLDQQRLKIKLSSPNVNYIFNTDTRPGCRKRKRRRPFLMPEHEP